MENKFLSLSRKVQIILLVSLGVLSICSFVFCSLVDSTNDNLYWLRIVLTCLGMMFGTVTVCLLIYFITGKPKEGQEEIEDNKAEDSDKQNDDQDQGEPYTQL